ncbi:MAG: adenine nucleotide alpha hydrolase family protein [Anaerolineales bacterium]|nr:adenine nucleotide alpha hydrolase family protein [Anaerolineales bacterium]MCX7755781.1 adenine nucleotide alpha hydrolase family protein [Anaerolineales bacterium]MDW8279039.1 ATP-binding protein [Anaerolineales bacterium]
MKCRTCGTKAAVNMRQHKLALCKQHFLEWLPEQTARFIKKYRMFGQHEKVLVAVSGGKDSLSLWDILHRLGYQADGLYLGLGIDEGIGYSDQSRRLTEQFARQRGLTLHVVDIRSTYGYDIPTLSALTHRGHNRPCAVCGVVKRHEMNRIARDLGYDVLATGHNLDDEVSVLLGNTFSWQVELMARQAPVLPAHDGLARKVKPLCRFYEKEMTAYALLRGIEYIYEECPFSAGSTTIYYKEMLNRLENDRPGAKLAFYLKFLEARESGLFQPPAEFAQPMYNCPSCGQLTQYEGRCSFCRMMEKAQSHS